MGWGLFYLTAGVLSFVLAAWRLDRRAMQETCRQLEESLADSQRLVVNAQRAVDVDVNERERPDLLTRPERLHVSAGFCVSCGEGALLPFKPPQHVSQQLQCTDCGARYVVPPPDVRDQIGMGIWRILPQRLPKLLARPEPDPRDASITGPYR